MLKSETSTIAEIQTAGLTKSPDSVFGFRYSDFGFHSAIGYY